MRGEGAGRAFRGAIRQIAFLPPEIIRIVRLTGVRHGESARFWAGHGYPWKSRSRVGELGFFPMNLRRYEPDRNRVGFAWGVVAVYSMEPR
jgi:hypothetical protein